MLPDSPAAARLTSNPQDIQRILAVRLDNIGDIVMLGPALRALRGFFPQAHLTLLASPAGSQVAPLLPWIDEVIPLRALWQDVSGKLELNPQRELELIEQLRAGRYDAAFIFTSFSQSPHPPGLICYLAGIPIRVGHSKEFGGGVLNITGRPPEDSGHQAERNLALLETAGIPVRSRHLELYVAPEVQNEADELLLSAGVDPYAPFVALAPGASCPARRYPPGRFAQAARLLARQSGLPLVILGSEREKESLIPFLTGLQHERPWVSLLGKTGVPQFSAVIRRAALVVANNSASLHIADAFERPLVILYSGTEYISQWEPRISPARLLNCTVPCSPCFRFECPYNQECLDIPPEEVAQAALELYQATSGADHRLSLRSPKPQPGDPIY
jgi:lipopolysaccharide heptosyltransferase II